VTWTPSGHHHYQPSPVQQPPSAGWKLAHSLWLLVPVLSFGCLSAAGFLYVGLRAHRPAWWIAGICYSVVGTLCLWLNSAFDEASDVGGFFALAWVLVWVVSVAHAVAINSSWLHWLAARQAPQPAPWAYPVAPAPAPVPPQTQRMPHTPAPYPYYATPTPPPPPPPDPDPSMPPPSDPWASPPSSGTGF
jgi:hypothetical protein